MLQIGEVAGRVGLSLRTIRHWDEVGLVVPSARSVGGFRLYTDADVERLQLVKSLKPLNLTLDQIRDLVQLMDTARAGVHGPDDDRAAEVRSRLALYRAAAEARIEALGAQLHGLQSLARDLKALSAPEPAGRTR
ncbi:MerR family transcriptional regulator [Pseudonocardia sulfidoxydans]|uniref:MerR family transcriptional regulator n=1 Tax=Pseudonocardia sulfidoxydans TaxID=54011 RepID=UPI001FE86965|nr:MerR family transcriptional regulator [Pseudonocardia sulfidoxydans]